MASAAPTLVVTRDRFCPFGVLFEGSVRPRRDGRRRPGHLGDL